MKMRYVAFALCLVLLVVVLLLPNSAFADRLGTEAAVAAYIQANPSISVQAQALPEPPPRFGFVSPGERRIQVGLTALMLLDTLQTVTIAKNPECLYEANPVAAAMFGSEHPSAQTVLITNTVYIAGHWLLGAYLDRKAQNSDRWNTVRRWYQASTFLGHGAAVLNNAAKGIRPFSDYRCNL